MAKTDSLTYGEFVAKWKGFIPQEFRDEFLQDLWDMHDRLVEAVKALDGE